MELFLWRAFDSGGWRERWEFWNQGPSRNGIAIEELPAKVSDVWRPGAISDGRHANGKEFGERETWACACIAAQRRLPNVN